MRLLLLGLLLLFTTACSTPLRQPVADFPVQPGEVGPIHPDNPLQQPFACATRQLGMGAPMIDNRQGIGQPVQARFLFVNYVAGYSRYCGAPMRVRYFYRSRAQRFVALESDRLPDDVLYIERAGRRVPFVIRLERGVINRFAYGITMLASPAEAAGEPDIGLWNRRLVMMFNGGIGIGRHQAGSGGIDKLGPGSENEGFHSIFNAALLARGYALLASTGMSTEASFHLPLLSQTALMVKQQFVSRYARPALTLGFGGSGGAIQQIYNANHQPGLLDGMVLSHVFPDMLTQLNPVGDCDLLEYYFDRGHRAPAADPYWYRWQHRRLVEGFNASNRHPSRLSRDGSGRPLMAAAEPGSSVCTEGWRGVQQVIFNPKMFLPFFSQYQDWLAVDPDTLRHTAWTHWDDLAEIYGVDESGFARRTYDNVGVQYGLTALRNGDLSPARFLHLNARVGAWKPSARMRLEQAPYYPYGVLEGASLPEMVRGNIALTDTSTFIQGLRNLIPLLPEDRMPLLRWLSWLGKDDRQSVWSHHNTTAAEHGDIAPRAAADPQALRAAYASGLVFDGRWPLPAIALLEYLDPTMDIHDARQAFVIRQRMRRAGSDPALLSIWGFEPQQPVRQPLARFVEKALLTMDHWLTQRRKPAVAADGCWDSEMRLLARGDRVWQGQGDGEAVPGECARRFPLHASPRQAAGEPFVGELLKCPLKPVSRALADGTYGAVRFSQAQQAYLQRIFPQGVCDYAADNRWRRSGQREAWGAAAP